jgi:hypothetical protein
MNTDIEYHQRSSNHVLSRLVQQAGVAEAMAAQRARSSETLGLRVQQQ